MLCFQAAVALAILICMPFHLNLFWSYSCQKVQHKWLLNSFPSSHLGETGHLMGPQQNGNPVSVSQEEEAFKLRPAWDNCPSQISNKQISAIKNTTREDPSTCDGCFGLGGQKVGEKRRTKVERAISLEVLQRHFAGSLKDAAKNIGVCPTTLKRICRQHGITRWPSRKIKKVGHSLRKLQLVIDSVHGVQNVQIGSFYTNFPELGSLSISGNDPASSEKPSAPQPEICVLGDGVAATESPSTSCSQGSGPSTSCSDGGKQQVSTISGDGFVAGDNPSGLLKRAHSEAQLHTINQQEPNLLLRSQSERTLGVHPCAPHLPDPMPKKNARLEGSFGVKASLGDVKIRFSLRPDRSFQDLQQEIARRFGVDDVSVINLKYLDDDREWVLLTCDADLEECRDLLKSAGGHTIKISIHPSQPNLPSSFGSMTAL